MKFAKEIFTILCDDIRNEIGGKISLMGIYHKNMIIPEIPFVLPKLCLWLSAREVQSNLGNLKVKVTIPQNEPLVLDFPAPPNQEKLQDMQIGLVIAPFTINGEGESKIDIFQEGVSRPLISHSFKIIKAKQT